MKTFRLTHWAELPQKFDQLKFRRAMSAMSAGPVDSDRLSKDCGLDRRELLALLKALLKAGAIVVHPSKPGKRESRALRASRGAQAPGSTRSRLMARLRNWLMADSPFSEAVNRV